MPNNQSKNMPWIIKAIRGILFFHLLIGTLVTSFLILLLIFQPEAGFHNDFIKGYIGRAMGGPEYLEPEIVGRYMGMFLPSAILIFFALRWIKEYKMMRVFASLGIVILLGVGRGGIPPFIFIAFILLLLPKARHYFKNNT